MSELDCTSVSSVHRPVRSSFVVLLLACVCASCATEEAYTRESPPCRLPDLSEEKVLELVKLKLGDDFAPAGYAPPNWRIRSYRCVYYFQLGVGYYKGVPVSLDTVDGSMLFVVTRDGKVFL